MDGIEFVTVDPRNPDAREVLRKYLDEVAGRIFSTTVADEIDDVDDFARPTGAFLLMRDGLGIVGCGAVRTLEPRIGEIKRMWIDPRRRREGLGAEMLTALEAASSDLGHERVRLDTNGALTPAIRMYESRGYQAIDRYSDNPDATHFFEKTLPTG